MNHVLITPETFGLSRWSTEVALRACKTNLLCDVVLLQPTANTGPEQERDKITLGQQSP